MISPSRLRIYARSGYTPGVAVADLKDSRACTTKVAKIWRMLGLHVEMRTTIGECRFAVDLRPGLLLAADSRIEIPDPPWAGEMLDLSGPTASRDTDNPPLPHTLRWIDVDWHHLHKTYGNFDFFLNTKMHVSILSSLLNCVYISS